MPVKQKNGGGNRYIVYTDPTSLLLGELKQKGIYLFSPAVKTDFFSEISVTTGRGFIKNFSF